MESLRKQDAAVLILGIGTLQPQGAKVFFSGGKAAGTHSLFGELWMWGAPWEGAEVSFKLLPETALVLGASIKSHISNLLIMSISTPKPFCANCKKPRQRVDQK